MAFRNVFCILLIVQTAVAKNPIITHMRTADPSVRVWDDGQMWLYCSHDQDDASDYSSMDGYHVFSSYDLVNWQDHGEVLHSRDVSWGLDGGGFMWAPDCAYKDGTYYFYFPHKNKNGQWRTGVATSDKPQGPFTDIGRPIDGTSGIDPMCFIDDDGQAYLYFGDALVAKLKDNMTELAESPRKIDYGASNFKEGPYMHKKDGVYYFSWTDWTDKTNQGYYAMGDHPYGPFEFMGAVNAKPPGAQDHHSIVEYRGQWYYFYHVGNYQGGSAHRRNVCVEYLYYNDDGSMQRVKQTTSGVEPDPIGSADAHRLPGRVQAEDYFRAGGVEVQTLSDSLTVVSSVHHGDWLEYVLEIIATEQYEIFLKVKPQHNATLNILVDDQAKQAIEVNSDGSDDWHVLSTTLKLNGGRHTITIGFENEASPDDLIHVDWIDFVSETTYYSITASASAGGDITPSGALFVKGGAAAEFHLNNHPGHAIRTILVDGIEKTLSTSYTFFHVGDDHTIHVGFAACDGAPITPYVQKNDEEKQQSASLIAYIGTKIVLSPETGTEGEWMWEGPGTVSAFTRELLLEKARIKQSGTYTVYFNNSDGCKSMQNFNVSITYKPLDVYDAANFTAQHGIQTESTVDIGGGRNIGYIHNGDWAEYLISIEQTGEHYLYFRVATGGGGSIVASIDGNTLATVPVSTARSSGWQDWYTTDSTTVQLEAGTHTLRLTFTGGSGFLFNVNWFNIDRIEPTGVETGYEPVMPRKTEIRSIYPNPFNPDTHIKYHMNENADVTLKVMNSMGQTVRILVEKEKQAAGSHVVRWDGKDRNGNTVASDVYLILLASGSVKQTQKLVLLR